MSAERKAELEDIIRKRTAEIRRLTEENARDAEELKPMHDIVSWIVFLSSTMTPPVV